MYTWVLILAILAGFSSPVQSKILVSERGPLVYFNSMDSIRSVELNKIAARCYIVLELIDSTHSIQLKQDLVSSIDTTYYQLGYDNLYGN